MFEFLLIAFSFQVGAEDCPKLQASDLSAEKVYALTQNPSCNIRSVDDLISHLPERFRTDYALFYRSRSIQGPVKTDYKRPRAILAGTDYKRGKDSRPRFMLSFNSGDPDQPAANSVEMVDIDIEGGKENVDVFKYRDLSFKEGKATLSSANPTKCKTCHGEPARPIYPGYPDWEGSYGSLHVGESTPEEIAGFKKYEEAIAINEKSRYRQLIRQTGVVSTDPQVQFRFANDFINGVLGSANAVRVARLMMQTPDYDQFKYAIAAGLLNCPGMEKFVPGDVAKGLHETIDRKFGLTKKWPREKLDETQRAIREHRRHFMLSDIAGTDDTIPPYDKFKKDYRKAFASSPRMERLYTDTFKVQGFSRADPMGANLRFLLEGRNVNIDNYFLDLMQPTYRYHNGANASVNTVEELIRHDEQLAQVIKPHYQDMKIGREMEKVLRTNPKLCASLKSKSLAALKKFRVSKADASTEAGAGCIDCARAQGGPVERQAKAIVDLSDRARRGPYPRHFTETCAKCHDSDLHVAPDIPFGDETKFREWLRKDENAALVKERLLHPDEEQRMPQNKRLREDEVDELLRYISVGN